MPEVLLALQCLIDDGRAEHRVCKFKNLLVYQSNIHYVYSGTALTVAECQELHPLHC